MKKIITLFFILYASFFTLSAQDSVRRGTWLTLNIHYGIILPFYANRTANLIHGNISALELDYVNKPTYQNNWIGAYHCPEMGIATFYEYLGNPTQLGNMYGAYPFINLHLKKTFDESLYLRLGFGFCYLPVIFNRITNNQDILIGSHLDALLTVRFNYHFYLSDKTRLEAGVGITHSSNGEITPPNTGLNTLTVNTGFSFGTSSPKKFAETRFNDSSKHKKLESDFIAAAGLSEIETPEGMQYPAYIFSYEFYRRMNIKSKLGLGVDIFYNEANIARLKQEYIFLNNKSENIQTGIKASYELTLGNIVLPFEIGGYLYTKYTGNGFIYNRIGIRYYTTKHLFANISLLTHIALPDFIEWGVGYAI